MKPAVALVFYIALEERGFQQRRLQTAKMRALAPEGRYVL
jgi:hypothetical protein